VSQAHPKDVSACSTLPGNEPQRGYQPRIGQHPDSPRVLGVYGYANHARIGRPQQDADHAVAARRPGYLAGLTVDNHAREAKSGV